MFLLTYFTLAFQHSISTMLKFLEMNGHFLTVFTNFMDVFILEIRMEDGWFGYSLQYISNKYAIDDR